MAQVLQGLCIAMSKQTRSFLIGMVCFMTLLVPSLAFAEGFALTDWSARGASLAGGLVARGGDASAVAYNPAAITELSGTHIMGGFELIIPTNTIDIETAQGTVSTDSEGLLFVLPHAYVTHKVNDQLSLGLGIFSRFGLGNEYDENWVGNQNMYFVELQTSTINPVVAWRFNDSFSIAAGLELTGAKVELKTRLNVGAPLLADFNLDHDGLEYAFGFNLAAHYRINDKWNAGLTYRSGVDFDFAGTATTSLASTVLNTEGASVTMSLPDQFSLALAYAPSKKLSFEAQMSYYVWSAYKNLDIDFDVTGLVPSAKNWKDTYLFSLSAEYQALEWLTLRAGIIHETATVPAKNAEYMTPVNGRWKYSLGAGVQKDNWAVDLAYVFYDIKDTSYDSSTAAGVSRGQARDVSAHSIMVSVSYKF